MRETMSKSTRRKAPSPAPPRQRRSTRSKRPTFSDGFREGVLFTLNMIRQLQDVVADPVATIDAVLYTIVAPTPAQRPGKAR